MPPSEVRRGLDVELGRRFAADLGRPVCWISFRWPELARDLGAGRFDLVLSGVTVRPDRSAAGRFSVPIARSGAVVLVPGDSLLHTPAELDRPGLRVAVNAGGHLERTAHAHLPSARIVPVADNGAVLSALAEGRVQAVVTDTLEAPHWRTRWRRLAAGQAPLRALGPLTRDWKAAWLAPEKRDLARRLDTWLLGEEAAGRLAALRRAHGLPDPDAATAAPAPALVAAIEERMALMPSVAEAKRRGGFAVRAPAVENRVLAAAARAVRERAGAGPAPDPEAVRAFYRALIDAAVRIQERRLAGPGNAAPVPPHLGLDGEIRPALLRIGERIAGLVVALARGGPPRDRASWHALLEDSPSTPAEDREPLVRALLWIQRGAPPASPQTRASQRRASPTARGSSAQAA